MTARKLLCVCCTAYAFLCATPSAADSPAPSDSSRLKSDAARTFAERLAMPGTEAYVRAFKQALGVADAVQGPPAPTGHG